MDENLVNLDDLQEALSQLETAEYVETEMSDEMKASQKRYEEYIKKNIKS